MRWHNGKRGWLDAGWLAGWLAPGPACLAVAMVAFLAGVIGLARLGWAEREVKAAVDWLSVWLASLAGLSADRTGHAGVACGDTSKHLAGRLCGSARAWLLAGCGCLCLVYFGLPACLLAPGCWV